MRLFALSLCLALASCAAGAKKSAAPASHEAAPSSAGATLSADPRQQIRDLEDQIIAARTELKLEDPGEGPLPGVSAEPMGAQPYSANPSCRPAASDTCKTSCTLSDSICGNADKICRIAQDLAGDAWATNKCAKANKTCESSRTKCCGCI
jgi:hypothetical protein